jgi:hypothetical protein
MDLKEDYEEQSYRIAEVRTPLVFLVPIPAPRIFFHLSVPLDVLVGKDIGGRRR